MARPADGGPPDPGGIGGRAGRLFTLFISGLNGVGTIWIFVIMVLINLDVFSRYLFNAPVRGVPLAVTMSIIAIVFLQLSDALRIGRLTRSDVMIGRLLARSPRIGHVLQMIYNAFGVILMALLFWYTVPFLVKAYTEQTYAGNEGDFTVVDWPISAVVLLGAACCCIQFARHFWQDIRYLRGYRDSEHMGTGGGGYE